MISYKNFRLFSQTTNAIKFDINVKPFVLTYYSENSILRNDYLRLNLRRNDFRHVVIPITKVPRTTPESEVLKDYKSYSLSVLTTKSLIPKKKNLIYDISNYVDLVAKSYDVYTSRIRRNTLLKNIVLSAQNNFSAYHRILLYSVVMTNEISTKFVNRRIFPILEYLKSEDGQYAFDDILLLLITPSKAIYRLLMKNQEVKLNGIISYVKNLKEINIDEEVSDEELDKAAEKITNVVITKRLVDNSNSEKVTNTIKSYLKNDQEKVDNVLSKNIKDEDLVDITSKSILTNVTGNKNISNKIVNNVPEEKKEKALKTITKNFIDEILPKEKTIITTENPIIKNSNILKVVDDKSPNHLFKKRQIDFQVNLKKDIYNSFKTLETKETPLKILEMEIVDKRGRPGEIEKSDESIVRTNLVDEFGNIHKVEIEIPRIDPNSGTFRINGRTKCLVNQLVQCPISFPKLYDSKFESSYSVFHISSKRTRATNLLQIYMAGYKLPLLVVLAYSFGFENTLKKYHINYELTSIKPKKGDFFCKISENSDYLLFTNIDTEVKQELVNSFIKENISKYSISKKFGSNEYFNDLIIKITGRTNSTYRIKNNLENILDPVARQILMNQNLPFVLEDIIKYMVEKTVEGYVVDRSDLINLRIRNSEVLVHLAQKQILASYTNYREQVLSGNTKAKFNLEPTKVKSEFINSEIVTDMEYGNPLEEMTSLTKVSPVGKGISGIPGKESVQIDARNVHNSYYGNIDPLDTPEGGSIGIVQQLTVNAMITTARGLFKVKDKKISEKSGILSTSSSMVPFIENNEGARIIMSDNQSRQVLPLKNPEPPITQSGYETILTSCLSDNFVKKAPCDSIINKINHNESIELTCSDTKKQVIIDITPKPLKSGSGKNTLSIFNPIVYSGQKVKKDTIIAEGSCIKDGTICMGRNLLTAVMPYKGYNFEDGVVINEKVVKNGKLTSLHLVEEEVLVSEKDRLLFIQSIGTRTNRGEILLRRTIGEIEELVGYEEDESEELTGQQYAKKSPGGLIVDIEVFSNVEDINKFKLVKELSERTNRKFLVASKDKFTIKGKTIKGILIKFKIQQELVTELSDKLCNRYGNKGIVSLIEPDDKMPRTPWGESIEFIVNPLGIINRMNIGQLYELYCGLISKELARRISSLSRKDSMEAIRKVISILDKTKNKIFSTSVLVFLDKMNETKFNEFRDYIKKNDFIPMIAPPFQSPTHRMIKEAMDFLNLKTKYKLYLPEYKTFTHYEVPVGYQYIQKLEHMGDLKIHSRSTGPVTGKVFQPTAGKSREGGQRLGELESYSFISYNAINTLQEFFGPLSDDLVTKNEIISEIIGTGKATYKYPKTNPTADLLKAYFVSLMLTQK